MLTWIIQSAIISIIFIFLVHYLIIFLKTTLTIPKIKDLVNSPNQKYQNIYDTISHNTSYTNIDLLPKGDIENDPTVNMKNELKSFLKEKLNNENNAIENLSGCNFSNL